MTVYLLTIIIFLKGGPLPVSKLFDNAFDCQKLEGTILTEARDSKDVIGWSVPAECPAIKENNKI